MRLPGRGEGFAPDGETSPAGSGNAPFLFECPKRSGKRKVQPRGPEGRPPWQSPGSAAKDCFIRCRTVSASTSAPPRLRSGADADVVLAYCRTSAPWRGNRSRDYSTTFLNKFSLHLRVGVKGEGRFSKPLHLVTLFLFSLHREKRPPEARNGAFPRAPARFPRPEA